MIYKKNYNHTFSFLPILLIKKPKQIQNKDKINSIKELTLGNSTKIEPKVKPIIV